MCGMGRVSRTLARPLITDMISLKTLPSMSTALALGFRIRCRRPGQNCCWNTSNVTCQGHKINFTESQAEPLWWRSEDFSAAFRPRSGQNFPSFRRILAEDWDAEREGSLQKVEIANPCTLESHSLSCSSGWLWIHKKGDRQRRASSWNFSTFNPIIPPIMHCVFVSLTLSPSDSLMKPSTLLNCGWGRKIGSYHEMKWSHKSVPCQEQCVELIQNVFRRGNQNTSPHKLLRSRDEY